MVKFLHARRGENNIYVWFLLTNVSDVYNLRVLEHFDSENYKIIHKDLLLRKVFLV